MFFFQFTPSALDSNCSNFWLVLILCLELDNQKCFFMNRNISVQICKNMEGHEQLQYLYLFSFLDYGLWMKQKRLMFKFAKFSIWHLQFCTCLTGLPCIKYPKKSVFNINNLISKMYLDIWKLFTEKVSWKFYMPETRLLVWETR